MEGHWRVVSFGSATKHTYANFRQGVPSTDIWMLEATARSIAVVDAKDDLVGNLVPTNTADWFDLYSLLSTLQAKNIQSYIIMDLYISHC